MSPISLGGTRLPSRWKGNNQIENVPEHNRHLQLVYGNHFILFRFTVRHLMVSFIIIIIITSARISFHHFQRTRERERERESASEREKKKTLENT